MRRRGLGAPLLVVSDGAAGIVKAIETCFPRSARQRCLAQPLGYPTNRGHLTRTPRQNIQYFSVVTPDATGHGDARVQVLHIFADLSADVKIAPNWGATNGNDCLQIVQSILGGFFRGWRRRR